MWKVALLTYWTCDMHGANDTCSGAISVRRRRIGLELVSMNDRKDNKHSGCVNHIQFICM